MNLFYLDEDLDKCAEYHVDKHVNKMILEAAQLLCTAIWVDRLLGFVPRALEKEEAAVLNEYKKEEKWEITCLVSLCLSSTKLSLTRTPARKCLIQEM